MSAVEGRRPRRLEVEESVFKFFPFFRFAEESENSFPLGPVVSGGSFVLSTSFCLLQFVRVSSTSKSERSEFGIDQFGSELF